MAGSGLTLSEIQEQEAQAHSTRVKLYEALEQRLQMPVVAYFASFDAGFDAMIEDQDAGVLQDVLQARGIKGDFALMISSPGGFPESAERFVSVCRSFADKGQFIALVPGLAKSAATMICFGADQIIMSESSELGPVDPQVPFMDGNQVNWLPAHTLVKTYDELFQEAVKTKGNMEPYIQQLKGFSAAKIKFYEDSIALSEIISIKHLQCSMMKGRGQSYVKNKIKTFIDPAKTRSHGRPIGATDAARCGLNIRHVSVHDPLWTDVYALYARLDNFVRTRAFKVLETRQSSLTWGAGRGRV